MALAVAAFSMPAVAAVPSSDAGFARKAAAAGMDEVDAGKLAHQRAQDPAVREFAERMVDDHTRAGSELHSIAQSEGLSIPGKLDKASEQALDKLTKLHGHPFDVAYMKHNVSAHETAVKDFAKEAKSGKDERLRRFAADTLPTLEQHVEIARSTAHAVGVAKPK